MIVLTSPTQELPQVRLSPVLRRMKTPIWLVIGQMVVASNEAAKSTKINADMLPHEGDERRVEVGGCLLQLSAQSAEEFGPGVRMVECHRDLRQVPEMSKRLSNHETHLSTLEDMVPGVLFQLERSPLGRHRFVHVGGRCKSVLGIESLDLEDRVDRLFDVIKGEDLRELKHALENSRTELSPLSWTGRASQDGSTSWLQITARPVVLDDKTVRWHGMITDVSEQKAMQVRAESRERLASVGELAAGVAHEINNPLAYVLANIRSALEDIPNLQKRDLSKTEVGEDGTKEISAMDNVVSGLLEAEMGAERVQEIVRDLKQLARPTTGNIEAVDVAHLVKSSVSMAMAHIRQRARLEVDVDVEHCALGNEARLTQVMLNLLVNAAQAIPGGHASDNAIVVRARSDDDNIVLEVEDTGGGIAPDVVARIYEPFFTTKGETGGTGLGLAMVHNIVREHGGRLEVESNIGKGTCFRVILAVAPSKMRAEPTARQKQKTRSMRRVDVVPRADKEATTALARVLIVDDEPALVRALARQLRSYDVTTASGGPQAKEILDGGASFDVILSDLMMPDCTGMELHAYVQQHDPDQAAKFVFMTGGVFTENAREFLDRTKSPVLEKPFEANAIHAIVEEVAVRSTAKRED